MERLIVGDLPDKMKARDVDAGTIERTAHEGIDYESCLGGFDNVENAMLDTIHKIDKPPLTPNDMSIKGMESTP